jgi:hypothetical protein
MNPLFFADWSRIHRVFRGLMWMVAGVLVLVMFFAVSSRADGGHVRTAPRAAARVGGPAH